jgi:hypothetical protein
MGKNYFVKLVNYIKNVYDAEEHMRKLSDGRVKPTYSTGMVILPVLLGFLLRIKSFNELNLMIKNNEFSRIIHRRKKVPKIDTIVRAKNNNNNSLRQVKKKANKMEPVEVFNEVS